MSFRRSIVAGTAGHIDHGKTTLVRALTGVNTDRLDEEQKRGITIELGFAPMDIDDVHVGFVDVPGHEKFVKNMLAGAGGIDAMLLVVSAEESVMPQTREHVEICRLLGIEKAVVAITKADLTDEETIELVALETHDLLEKNGYGGAAIVPVSATTGKGLDELRQRLKETALAARRRQLDAAPRLPIDRVFTIKGHGTVVTGTLISGSLQTSAKLQAYPSDLTAAVKSLQVHGESVPEAQAGHRVAINLANVSTEELDRGMLLAPPGAMNAATSWDVECTVLDDSPCSVEQNTRVRVHSGSAEVLARVSLHGDQPIAPGDRGIIRLRLEEPLSGYIGDRIVLRRYSPMITIAGAVLLDNDPPFFSKDRRQQAASLRKMAEANPSDWLAFAAANQPGSISIAGLIRRFGFSPETLERQLLELAESGSICIVNENPLEICAAAVLASVKKDILTVLEKLHGGSPLKESFPRNNLPPLLGAKTPASVFTMALAELEQDGRIAVSEGRVRLADHSVELSPELQTAIEQLEETYRRAAFAPPKPVDAIGQLTVTKDEGQALLDILISKGTVRLIAEDFFLHADTLASLRGIIEKESAGKPFGVPQFKDWLGISRKFAIPLLEYLDRQGITYRKGDERLLGT